MADSDINLDSLLDISSIIHSIENSINVIEENKNPIEQVQERVKIINSLNNSLTSLKDLCEFIANKTTTLKNIQSKTINDLSNKLVLFNNGQIPKTEPIQESDWSLVTDKKHKQTGKSPGAQFRKIEIGSLFLYAIPVKTWDDLRTMQRGVLYYVSDSNHFAYRINDFLFHGNIGTIYTDEKEPKYIKNCSYGNNCNKPYGCAYYHNPRYCNTRDIRCFTANSYQYSNNNSINSNKKQRQTRKFGSRDNLNGDIARLDSDGAETYFDQVVNDSLCALLLGHQDKLPTVDFKFEN